MRLLGLDLGGLYIHFLEDKDGCPEVMSGGRVWVCDVGPSSTACIRVGPHWLNVGFVGEQGAGEVRSGHIAMRKAG